MHCDLQNLQTVILFEGQIEVLKTQKVSNLQNSILQLNNLPVQGLSPHSSASLQSWTPLEVQHIPNIRWTMNHSELNKTLSSRVHHKKLKRGGKEISLNLSSCPPLFKTNVELVIQQLLIVCAHINGNRQALQVTNKNWNISVYKIGMTNPEYLRTYIKY